MIHNIARKLLLILIAVYCVTKPQAFGQNQTIVDMEVRGNGKVESDAILTIIKSRKGDELDKHKVQEDIKTLWELNYFSDVRLYSAPVVGGIKYIIEVKEKPSIANIKFEGLKELKEEDFKEKIETKLYTIVNEATITNDLRIIEKQYTEQGFYLAKATYKIEPHGKNEVDLTFIISEGGKVQVADVYLLGNQYFTDEDIISKLYLRPLTRSSAYATPGSLFQDDFLKRDLEFIAFYYKDQGFAKVKVGKPITVLDKDREFVRVTFSVEEGLQYNTGTLDVSGDLLFPKEELLEAMILKPGKLWRYSQFSKDVEMLVDKYGDLGYAFVDVNPITVYHDDKRLIDINYEITKGDKVYFGEMTIVGNTKTRDNVVRRELEISDGSRYSGTGLTKSKKNIERLGFFEEVQTIKRRDNDNKTLLHYKIKVKEKPTGQLQAAIGFSPGQGTGQNNWFGQGRYNEENQSGKGWKTNLTGKWNGEQNYSLEAGFTDPRVNDSWWSLGFDAFLINQVRKVTDDVAVQERQVGGSTTLGRKIIELIRGSITYRIKKISQTSEQFLLDRFKEQGISSSVILGLTRNSTDNYIDPTEGSSVRLRQQFTGGPYLGGDFEFMESSFDGSYFLPIDFTETYRSYFRFYGLLSYIYPLLDKPVPFFERYRMGGPSDLRGFKYQSLGPKFNLLQTPNGVVSPFTKGGDKKLLFQVEYFLPLIPEAGIKAIFFHDVGRVYDDDEPLELAGFYRDFGFGFRWITPIAPFRFEWAYPIIDGRPGDLEFVFYLGY